MSDKILPWKAVVPSCHDASRRFAVLPQRISIAVTITCLMSLLEIGTAKVVVMKNNARGLGNLMWTSASREANMRKKLDFRYQILDFRI